MELSCVLILVKHFSFLVQYVVFWCTGQYPIHSCCGRSGVPGHQWKSVNGRWCPPAGPHSLSMNKFYPEEPGPEQKSPCNSVVRDYSEGRELGGRSQHYKTHVIDQSSNLLFRNHQQHLPRCPKYIFFFTQVSREISLFVQGYCYMKWCFLHTFQE